MSKPMIIKCRGEDEPLILAEVVELSLKVMQGLVGGLIQPVTLDEEGTTLWLNEEGKIRGLPFNRNITDQWGQVWDVNGPFFLCGYDEEEGLTKGLTILAATKWLALLRGE